MLVLRTIGDLSRRLAAWRAAEPRRWPRLAGDSERAGRGKGARRLKQDPLTSWAQAVAQILAEGGR